MYEHSRRAYSALTEAYVHAQAARNQTQKKAVSDSETEFTVQSFWLVRIRLSGVGSRTSICTTSNNSGSTCFLVLYQQINYVSILENHRINTISSV